MTDVDDSSIIVHLPANRSEAAVGKRAISGSGIEDGGVGCVGSGGKVETGKGLEEKEEEKR